MPAFEWKVAEGLPEAATDYDDSSWTGKVPSSKTPDSQKDREIDSIADADHMTTPHFIPPDTFPVLFADEYGYQAGNILWRGRFSASKGEIPTSAYLRVIGGLASGFSVYVNGEFLGAWLGAMKNKTGEIEVSFEGVQLNTDSDNVLFVIQDTMGKEQREAAPDPRGILTARLYADETEVDFDSWKVAGNAGGNHLIEPVRGTYNEGGLHAERLGWHLPGFDDSEWEAGSPDDGFEGATARFYRTVVPLDLPENYDISIAFELKTAKRAKLRAQLYVNGYQYAKILPHVGNEITFPGKFQIHHTTLNAFAMLFNANLPDQLSPVFLTIMVITPSVLTSGPWTKPVVPLRSDGRCSACTSPRLIFLLIASICALDGSTAANTRKGSLAAV